MNQHYQAFGLNILSPNSREIQRLQSQYPSSLHGDKVWHSSFLLMHYLLQHPLAEHSKVLDLGCGWGLLSLFLQQQGDYTMTALDADANMLAYLQAHAELNQLKPPTFTDARFEQLDPQFLQQFDVILAADVCFWDELNPIHQQLIDLAVEAGVETIIYSDPMRPPFHELVDYCCEQHFAEAFELTIDSPVKAQGAIMRIDNG